MPIAVIIDWYRQYHSKDELKEAMKSYDTGDRVVYMALKKGNVVNYIGMTEQPWSRMNNHEKMAHPDNIRFFCGNIETKGLPGRRTGKAKIDLKMTENALISWFQPELNTKLKNNALHDCIVIYSRFFEDSEEIIVSNPLPKFPKLLAYNYYSEEWEC